MTIGINAVAALKSPRTGVEEYTYQLIKHLAMLEGNKRHRFVLYVQNQDNFDFPLPDNFKIKSINWNLPMWTQLRLSSEMLVKSPETLFIPVHALPLIHPMNSIVVLHGLEYEYYPKMYPKKHLQYLRWSTKHALNKARRIIAVSENTKKDLVELYGGDPEKIDVVYHGVDLKDVSENKKSDSKDPFILFIGSLEEKKNIRGLIKSFELLKERYDIPHKLILVGKRGYGFERMKFGKDVVVKGYVEDKEKQKLLRNAEMLVLPSLYEGFGIPILEAQANGCPVITSNISSMPEVAGKGAILVEPRNIEEICESMNKIISDREFSNNLISMGYDNAKKFSWEKCAQETLKVLTDL